MTFLDSQLLQRFLAAKTEEIRRFHQDHSFVITNIISICRKGSFIPHAINIEARPHDDRLQEQHAEIELLQRENEPLKITLLYENVVFLIPTNGGPILVSYYRHSRHRLDEEQPPVWRPILDIRLICMLRDAINKLLFKSDDRKFYYQLPDLMKESEKNPLPRIELSPDNPVMPYSDVVFLQPWKELAEQGSSS